MQARNKYYTSQEEAETLLKETLDSSAAKNTEISVEKKTKKRKRIISRIIYVSIILAMLVMLGKVWYQKLNDETPSLFGYQLYVVETGSMVPTLPIGTNLLVRQFKGGDELQTGDIITFTRNSSAVTHRIIDLVVGEDGVTRYQTKGDNPDNSIDPWLVERSDVRGVVIWHFSLSNLFGK